MFKSTQEFNKAMHAILLNIRDGEDFFSNLDIDESDAVDALERAIDQGLIMGVAVKRAMGGQFLFSKNNPRLSYEGLEFVEHFKG